MNRPRPFFINIMPRNDRRDDRGFLSSVERCAADSVRLGFQYTLITFGHKRFDPWVLAQHAMRRNPKFAPLIAVNPAYEHPAAAAKRVASLTHLFPNRLALNLITGSFINELSSLGDTLAPDARNKRLEEFCRVLQELLSPAGRSDHRGRFYRTKGLEIFPKLARPKLDIFVSGSFQGLMGRSTLAPLFVRNLRPPELLKPAPGPDCGLGLGICARATAAQAQAAVRRLFPPDRSGRLLFSLALQNTDTPWNRWLRPYLSRNDDARPDFDLTPMRNFASNVPFIVGSYEQVAEKLKGFVRTGYRFFLTDFHSGDGEHVKRILARFRA